MDGKENKIVESYASKHKMSKGNAIKEIIRQYNAKGN